MPLVARQISFVFNNRQILEFETDETTLASCRKLSSLLIIGAIKMVEFVLCHHDIETTNIIVISVL